MKVHLVSVDFPPERDGGVASWAEDLGRALVGAGADVVVYTRSAPKTRAYDAALPFPVVRMVGRSWGRWQAQWVAAQVGWRLRHGDRLLFSTWPAGAILGPWAAGRGVKVGVAFHGSELTRLHAPPEALTRLLRVATACLPVSDFLSARLRALGGRGRPVPMPAPASAELPRAEGQGLIVVARLNPLKGVERAVRLAAALGWPLEIGCDGPSRPRVEALVDQLGADVTLVGRRPRAEVLQRLRGKAACMLLPHVEPDGSGAEGLGLCLLEAMGQGTPAIGNATGGVPEALGPGLLLADPDDVQGAATTIRAWLKDGGRGAEGHAWVRAHHGPERAAAAVLEALA